MRIFAVELVESIKCCKTETLTESKKLTHSNINIGSEIGTSEDNISRITNYALMSVGP